MHHGTILVAIFFIFSLTHGSAGKKTKPPTTAKTTTSMLTQATTTTAKTTTSTLIQALKTTVEKSTTTAEPTKHGKSSGDISSDTIFLIVGCSIGGVIFIFVCILICHVCRKSCSSRSDITQGKPRSTPNNYETEVFSSHSKHFSVTSETSLVNKGFEMTPLKLPSSEPIPYKVGKSQFVAKPYGEMGQTAASPFVGSAIHNKRLRSISPSPSFDETSLAQYILGSRRDSSVTVISNISQPRRDSGYVDVNISHAMKKRFNTSSELKPKHTDSPLQVRKTFSDMCQINSSHDVKPKQPNRAMSETSPRADKFPNARSGQALEYCRKARGTLPKKALIPNHTNAKQQTPRQSQYENVQVDEHVYTPVNEYNNNDDNDYMCAVSANVGNGEISDGYSVVKRNTTQYCGGDGQSDGDYTIANPYPLQFHNGDMDYEVPKEMFKRDEQADGKHYVNLNAKVESEYQNFDYKVPVLNPTSVDEENEYLEFIPDVENSRR